MVRRVTENSVNPQGYTGARLRPADFQSGGEAIARGAQQLGQGIQQGAEAIDKINEIYDTAAVKRADAEDLKQIMEIRAKALSAEGFDAQTAIKDARTQIEEIKKRRMAGLSNGRQQRMYSDVFDQRALQIEEQFTNHSIKQISAANKAEAAGRADTLLADAHDVYGTDAFQPTLDTALSEIANANPGAGPAAIGRLQQQAKSGVYSRIVSGLLTDPDGVDEAEVVLNTHAADILPEDEEKLRRQINPLIEENLTNSRVGWAFTNAPIPGAEERDPLAPLPAEESSAPPAGAQKESARPSLSPTPADPTRGVGRVTETAAGHRARGSSNALDIAAPEGTPLYPPMSGTVSGDPFWSEKGGWSVLIEHPNGYITGYAHMRSKPPLRDGQKVDSTTIIGSVGSTGESTGPHVHYTVHRSKGGPKIDPAAAVWGSEGTVDPKSVDWKEGELPRFTPEENALGRALERLHQRATAENWSNREYMAAVEGARRIAGVQDQLYNQQQEARYKTALSTAVELGDKFTSRSQIPGFGLLDPGHQLSLDNMIKGNLGGDSVKEGGAGFLTALTLQYTDPARFAALTPQELIDMAPTMTGGEFKRVYTDWLELNADPKGELAASRSEANSYASQFLPRDIDITRRNRFRDKYTEAVNSRQAELKRRLTPDEKEAIARSLTVQVVRYEVEDGKRGDVIDKNSYMFDYKGVGKGEFATVNFREVYDTIPQATRDEIILKLRNGGKPHTMKDVVREFLDMGR